MKITITHTYLKNTSLFVCCIFLSFLAQPSVADTVKTQTDSPFSFEFTPSIGVLTGTVSEYVFYDTGDTESQLDWQQYAVPYIQAKETIRAYNAFLNVSLLSAIPFECGIIEDYDWLNDDTSILSDYSCHDLYLDKRFDITANAGYTFNYNKFFIAPGLGVTYRSQKWSGYDGYGQDGDDDVWTEDTDKTEYSGNVISYEQSIVMPFISLQSGYAINQKMNISLDLLVYPYLYINDIDNHYTKDKEYLDEMRGGGGISIGSTITYKKIALQISYEYLYVDDGTIYYTTIGSSDTTIYESADATAGTSSSLFSISVLYLF
jgi:outer membrane protease